MDWTEFSFWVSGDKLLFRSDRIHKTAEFYLPDCKEEQIEKYISKWAAEYAAVMAFDRPWRPDSPFKV